MPSVGKDIPHDSARGHVPANRSSSTTFHRHGTSCSSTSSARRLRMGRLLSLDISEAATVPGVVAILTAKDIPGHNKFGPIIADEHLLVDEQILFPVIPSASSPLRRASNCAAKKLVKMQVKEEKPIFTIDDAIAAKSFIGPKRTIECGDVNRRDGRIRSHARRLIGDRRAGTFLSRIAGRDRHARRAWADHDPIVHTTSQRSAIARRGDHRRPVQSRRSSSASVWVADLAAKKRRPPNPQRWRRSSRSKHATAGANHLQQR